MHAILSGLSALCFIVSLVLLWAAPARAQDAVSVLSDEFDGQALSGWTRFDEAFGWPDKVKRLEIAGGVLRLEPHHSAWVRDLNAPFLFKAVEGDFDVRVRMRVRGADGAIAGGTWSLGGLMARIPSSVTAKAWRPRAENWHFITTGVGHEPGRQMTETKSTFNSYSSLKLRPFPTGWVELRLVRVGMAIFALARPEGDDAWQVRDRFYRMEHRPRMQVGLIAYTTSPDAPEVPEDPELINRAADRQARTDMVMEVDWIRFATPKVQAPADWYAQVSAHPLADPGLSDTELLARLGA